jgi:methyltransferase
LAELWLARRNATALLLKGAREVAPGHYPAIVLLHASWLASLWTFGWSHSLSSVWLAIFLVLQVFRI